jgi:ribosomal protein L11 methyltransferase
MLAPDTNLYIYEIPGEAVPDPATSPPSFVGLWNEEGFSYLFFTAPEDAYVADLAKSHDISSVSRHEMQYRDWQTGLPSVGLSAGGVTFVPADHPAPPAGALLLDPSVVFGDGNHPTTLACLRCLEEIVRTRHPRSVLDLGTGTGILALAAAALGVERVLAVDKNHLSVLTARQNVEVNALSSCIEVQDGEARCFIEEPFDLVAANLPFSVLRDLIPLRHASLHPIWIVSGINAEQAGVLKDLFSEQQFACTTEYVDPPWVTFVAVSQRNIETVEDPRSTDE